MTTREVRVPADGAVLPGDLVMPGDGAACGVILFAHGSGSSRHSPRNREVAARLHEAGLATLLLDLLTAEEEAAERHTRHLRFDIGLLIDRLEAAVDALTHTTDVGALPIGCFGASTGAAAALGVAGRRPEAIAAVVSRGGRPDLTPPDLLAAVRAPTLLIVGGRDEAVIAFNEDARRALRAPVELQIVPGASHLFEEPGALERVGDLAAGWFTQHLAPRA